MKKVDIHASMKRGAKIFGTIGLIAGIIYSFGGLAIDTLVSLGWMTSTDTPGLSVGTLLAFGALIGMPAIGIVIGFVVGIMGAVVYNSVSR